MLNDNDNLIKITVLLKKIVKLGLPNPVLNNELGKILLKGKSFDDAITAFQKAVQMEPDSPTYLYNLGDTYLAAGKPTDAIPLLIKAIERDHSFTLAHYDLSLAYFMLRRFEEGAAEAKLALGEDPEMTTQGPNLGIGATNNLAVCLMNLGKLEEAEGILHRNIKLFASTYFNLGMVLFKKEKYEEALKNFQTAIEIEPDDAEYLNMLGNTYDSLGRINEAKEALEKAIKVGLEYSLGYYDLGRILAREKNQQVKALEYLSHSIKLDPELFWAYYGIACIYAMANNKELALHFLEQSLIKGLKDYQHIEQDTDLDNIKNEPAFKAIIGKYLPH